MKFIVDLWLDGYDSEEDMEKACIEFIKESLDFSASSVSVEVFRPTPLAPDGADVCHIVTHFFIDGTCAMCGVPEPRPAGKA